MLKLPLNLKTIALVSIGVVFLGLIFFQPHADITVKNDSAAPILNTGLPKTGKQNGLLSSLFSSDSQDSTASSLDIANQILLDQPDAQQRKDMVHYMNSANDAIPLSEEALSFALQETILGQKDSLNDVVLRLQEGQLALAALKPPLDAIAFNKMSTALLKEYQKLFTIFLTAPPDQFDSTKLEDNFKRLDALVGIARRELALINTRYATPLSAKVVSFYENVIGAR